MARQFQQLRGLKVVVQRVAYDPSLAAPPDRPYPFVYDISIINNTERTVTFFGRKWILNEHDGCTLVVEGDGIVGQYPCLRPSEVFSYSSYHTIARDCLATGAFFGTTETGEPVGVKMPLFEMEVPALV